MVPTELLAIQHYEYLLCYRLSSIHIPRYRNLNRQNCGSFQLARPKVDYMVKSFIVCPNILRVDQTTTM